jgi:hypothetical protein
MWPSVLDISLHMFSGFIHVIACINSSFFFGGRMTYPVWNFVYLIISAWTLKFVSIGGRGNKNDAAILSKCVNN